MFDFLKRSKIPVKQTTNGSHGDHWGAVFGFDCEDLEKKVVGMAGAATPCGGARGYQWLEYSEPPFVARGIATGSRLETIYPTLQVSETVPVTLKEITEWQHVKGIEAQVGGAGRDTFGLNFFATDYLTNRSTYRKGGVAEVALAGMAFVIKEALELPEDFAHDFCSYMPNQEFTSGDAYDFIGDVLTVDPITVYEESLHVVRVKLINMEDNPDMFVLPLLANPNNLEVDLQPGTKVSGCFWLTGAIA